MRKFLGMLLVSSVLVALTAADSFAADRYVAATGGDAGNSCLDGAAPCATIAHAIAEATSGDTIHLAAGRYREANLQPSIDLSFVGNGASDTIIDADTDSDGTGDNWIILIDDGNTINVSNITFTNGYPSMDGGAIYNTSSTLNVSNCIFTGNDSDGNYGGAIFSDNALTVEDSTFTNNLSGDGGAIHVDGGTAEIRRCTITDNQAVSGYGGGMSFDGTSLTMTDTTIDSNHANDRGGGLLFRADATIRRCTISNNTSNTVGGGVEVENNSTVNIVNSTISGNTAIEDGGGVRVSSGGPLPNVTEAFIYNTTITANVADKNEAGFFGGGIYILDDAESQLTIYNSIVAGNMLGTADEECYKGTNGVLTSGGYNIFDAASATCDPSLDATDATGVDVTIVIDTFLADNGGPTLTHALIAESPAIDAGTPTAAGGCRDHTATALAVDQRSMTRPVNDRCDVGAVELGTCGDGVVDAGEACDDGNDDNTDNCLDTCVDATCGDGSVQAGVEECDDGNTTDGDGCAADCTTEAADDGSDPSTVGADSSGGGCSMMPSVGPAASSVAPLLLIAGLGLVRRRKRNHRPSLQAPSR